MIEEKKAGFRIKGKFEWGRRFLGHGHGLGIKNAVEEVAGYRVSVTTALRKKKIGVGSGQGPQVAYWASLYGCYREWAGLV